MRGGLKRLVEAILIVYDLFTERSHQIRSVSTFIENLIKSLDAVGTVVKTTLSSPE